MTLRDLNVIVTSTKVSASSLESLRMYHPGLKLHLYFIYVCSRRRQIRQEAFFETLTGGGLQSYIPVLL